MKSSRVLLAQQVAGWRREYSDDVCEVKRHVSILVFEGQKKGKEVRQEEKNKRIQNLPNESKEKLPRSRTSQYRKKQEHKRKPKKQQRKRHVQLPNTHLTSNLPHTPLLLNLRLFLPPHRLRSRCRCIPLMLVLVRVRVFMQLNLWMFM